MRGYKIPFYETLTVSTDISDVGMKRCNIRIVCYWNPRRPFCKLCVSFLTIKRLKERERELLMTNSCLHVIYMQLHNFKTNLLLIVGGLIFIH
jgi:hypothetical protein